MNPIRSALLKYNSKGWTDVKEMAMLCDCSERKIYKVLEGEAHLTHEEVRMLSVHFSQMGRLELSMAFLAPKYSVTVRGQVVTNGSMADELRDLVHYTDDMLNKYENADEQSALAACDRLQEVVNRARAEIKTKG